jgi:hypothetical protein
MTAADQLSLLLQLSAELQRAHTRLHDAGRDDLAQCLRNAAWDVDAAIAKVGSEAAVTA